MCSTSRWREDLQIPLSRETAGAAAPSEFEAETAPAGAAESEPVAAAAVAGDLAAQSAAESAAREVLPEIRGVDTAVLSRLPLDPQATFNAMAMFALSGALFNAVQATMYALAAHVFPAAIRSTGVGATVAVGRVGNVAASYVGSWALSAGGPPTDFFPAYRAP